MRDKKTTNSDDARARFDVGQVLRHGHDSVLIADEVFTQDAVDAASESVLLVVGVVLPVEEALGEQRRHLVTNSNALNSRTSCDYVPGGVGTGDDPSLNLNRGRVATGSDLGVPRVERDGADLDQDLGRREGFDRRDRSQFDREVAKVALQGMLDHDGFHRRGDRGRAHL